MVLTGQNWQGDATVRVFTNDHVFSSWNRNVYVSVAADGTITDSFNLPNWFVADYSVVATGLQTGRVATTTFTDAAPPSNENLWQCDPPTGFDPATYTCVSSGTSGWSTGNNDGPYKEGDTVPYRTRFQNLVVGPTTASTSSGTPRSRASTRSTTSSPTTRRSPRADPCLSLSGLPAGLCSSASTTPIPADSFMQASADWITNGGVQDPGVFTMFGGTSPCPPRATRPRRTTPATLRPRSPSSSLRPRPTLCLPGAVTSRRGTDWGPASSAVSIPGSPYHMRLTSWRDEDARRRTEYRHRRTGA